MLDDLAFDLRSLHDAYGRGVQPADVVDECFRRLEQAADPGIFLHLCDRKAVKAEAARLGAFDPVSKPLWGIPFAIKDNIDAAGAPTTAACPAFAYDAKEDAFVVRLLRDAGALLIGKTNLDQFATGLVGVRTPFPAPRNAIDPAMVPGGSSSGSAVVVARGIVSFALGTDTAGSGRVPAALNGIVGLKPSLGALSARGVVPACRSLDAVSIFALTAADAYSVLQVAARLDEADSFARPLATPPLAAPAAKLRIGVPDQATREFFGDTAQAASFDDTLARMAALGADIVPMDFAPFYRVADLLYGGTWVAERYTVVADLLQRHPDALVPAVHQIITGAERFSAADAFRDSYRLRALRHRVAPLVNSVDLLCVPTMPGFCTVAEIEADPIGPNSRLGTYTNFVNLLDLCGIAVPVAPRPDGRPGNVTLLGKAGRDSVVAAFAHVLQTACGGALGATGWPMPETTPLPPRATPDEIALAVVGAHMSGLPLNKELTNLGARFLRRASTAPSYRLFRLPGEAPVRPGLVCVPEDGAAIDLEVWSVPAERFGDFLRGVLQPLGIGTLTLADGERVNGFLCEHYATRDGQDVTACGGWRNYLETLSASR